MSDAPGTRAGPSLGPVEAHTYFPLEIERSVLALHADDLKVLGLEDHDWVTVRRADRDQGAEAIARVENAEYVHHGSPRPVEPGAPRLSRPLRRRIDLGETPPSQQVFIGRATMRKVPVRAVVHPDPYADPSSVWVSDLDDLVGRMVELEHQPEGEMARRITGRAIAHEIHVAELSTDTPSVALTRPQQVLLGFDARKLAPGYGADFPTLTLRAVPDLEPALPGALRQARRTLATFLVGESTLGAEVELGKDLDGQAGIARLSQDLFDALGLATDDWIRLHDGLREVQRRVHPPIDSDTEAGRSRIWLDGNAMGELDLRWAGDSVLVSRDPVQTVRNAVGSNVMSAVLAFVAVVVVDQSLLGVICAFLAALLVLYLALAQQRARVRRHRRRR